MKKSTRKAGQTHRHSRTTVRERHQVNLQLSHIAKNANIPTSKLVAGILTYSVENPNEFGLEIEKTAVARKNWDIVNSVRGPIDAGVRGRLNIAAKVAGTSKASLYNRILSDGIERIRNDSTFGSEIVRRVDPVDPWPNNIRVKRKL